MRVDLDLIEALKKKRKAVILAHNYQLPEVQDMADFVGDSLEMAFRAIELSSDVVVVAGVRFMAELVAAINPDKIVLHPEPSAGCPLADKINVNLISEARSKFRNVPVVVYVNSPIEVKALADYFVTSSSALKLISKLRSDNVIFGPDKNLANYISEKLNINVVPLPQDAFCPVHEHLIDAYYVEDALRRYPNAKILLHPEVPPESRRYAHFIGGTSQMILAIGEIEGDTYLLGTEEGLAYRAKRIFDDKNIYPLNYRAVCVDMKKITPRKILNCLENLKPRVSIDREILIKSRDVIFESLDFLG
ncbi:MAG: quinolinate synthase NadA [Candidatus Methanomethylicia archaeon]